MITEDAILNFIPTRVSGTGFSASQFGLNLSSGSGSVSVSGSGSGFQIPAFPYALRLSRKGGYFQHWLEYSIAFEVLETREKLNTVLSSWETFEDF